MQRFAAVGIHKLDDPIGRSHGDLPRRERAFRQGVASVIEAHRFRLVPANVKDKLPGRLQRRDVAQNQNCGPVSFIRWFGDR